jgi:Prealbumin-like fold domain
MTVVRFKQRRVRRWWYLGMTVTAFALFAVIFVTASGADNPSGCDFAANGTTESCSGPLAGSTFAGGDGNLLTSPTTFGTTDWQNVAGLNTGVDLPSGGTDNAFGGGTKEDDPNVNVVTGSIPPQKSDLTRFYEASEFANNSNFLYLAWERTNSLGSANMDFEINQKTQPDLTTTGAKTLIRTAGDLLVTFDFTNGGGRPTLALLTWVTSGATSQCFSSNSLPCWGNRVVLNGTNSIGAVNNLDAVTDPFLPGTNNIGVNRFGEAAINLTAAGVFPPGTCEAFGSVFLKSRSSASFPAEVKDFVAPVPVNISNCGTINIIKHTNPRGIDQNFSYTSTIPDPAQGSTTPTCTLDSTPSSFTLNDDAGVDPDPIAGSANTEHCVNVPAGSYTVTEGTLSANFVLESLTCTPGGSQDGTDPAKANITVVPGGTVTCTYTNKQQLGAIKVTKTRKHAVDGPGDHPHAGVSFTVNGVTKQTDANGVACFDGLAFATYTVHETVPAGYHVVANDKSVTVDNNATCSANPYVGETVSFHNTPLTDLRVAVNSQVDGGTASTVTCTPAGPSGSTNTNGDFDGTTTDLEPGTYTCVVVVDP